MAKTRREQILGAESDAAQREAGERDEFINEFVELEEKTSQVKLSKESGGPDQEGTEEAAPGCGPCRPRPRWWRNYIDVGLALPWGHGAPRQVGRGPMAEPACSIRTLRPKKVKERILEYLAVQALVRKQKGPILCLVGPRAWARPRWLSPSRGPPGATSCAWPWAVCATRPRSAATAHLYRRAAGQDHPVAQEGAGSANPVFLLDEVDKMVHRLPRRSLGGPAGGSGSQGTHLLRPLPGISTTTCPTSFLTTAIPEGIPVPLQDRMEVIPIAGVHRIRKLAIDPAVPWCPKQQRDHGLGGHQVWRCLRSPCASSSTAYTKGKWRAQSGA